MAKRKAKARKSKVRFLFVRGRANDVYITVAPAPISDAKLAGLIDQYVRRSRSVTRAREAFFVEGDVRVLSVVAETFTGVRRPPPPPPK
jgi:hypothetical protein